MSDLTCILPCHNAERFLSETLESLAAQSLPAKEILLIDDGSTDRSLAIAAQANLPNLRILRQENQGPSAARTLGLAEVKTEFVAFFDADDLAPPDRFARLLAPFADTPALEAVFGHWENFWDAEVADEEQSAAAAPLKGRKTTPFLTAAIFRRACFTTYGTFVTQNTPQQDLANLHVQWMDRAFQQDLRSVTIDSLVLRRRVHRTNLSRQKTTDTLFDMIAASRRRAKTQND